MPTYWVKFDFDMVKYPIYGIDPDGNPVWPFPWGSVVEFFDRSYYYYNWVYHGYVEPRGGEFTHFYYQHWTWIEKGMWKYNDDGDGIPDYFETSHFIGYDFYTTIIDYFAQGTEPDPTVLTGPLLSDTEYDDALNQDITLFWNDWVWVTVTVDLFTNGSDRVNFNSLEPEQEELIAAASDRILLYNGFGGGDIVNLPDKANFNKSVGNGKTLGWADSASSPFTTGSKVGDTYTIIGSDGDYFIMGGAGTDNIIIAGHGNTTITAGSGTENIEFRALTPNYTGFNTVRVNYVGDFKGQIEGFWQGDVINLARVDCRSAPILASYADGTLSLTGYGTIKVTEPYGGDPIPVFGMKPDEKGEGTDVGTTSLKTLFDIAFATYGADPDNRNFTPPSQVGSYSLVQQTDDGGFRAVAYLDILENGDSSIVISFRGTDNPTAFYKNWVANGSFFAGVPNPLFQRYIKNAANFVANIEKSYSDELITVVGHSLGGGIAELLGKATHFATATFNAPGSEQLYSKLTSDLGPAMNLGFGGTITNYRAAGDLVSLIGVDTKIGQTYTIDNPISGSDPKLSEIISIKYHGQEGFGNGSTLTNPSFYHYEDFANATEHLLSLTIDRVSMSSVGLSVTVLGYVHGGIATLIDPDSGASVSFTTDAGSPNLASITLPAVDGVAFYKVRYETGITSSGYQRVLPGVTELLPGEVKGIEFNAFDFSGQAVVLPSGFNFAASFSTSGVVSGTLNILGSGPVALPVTVPAALTVQENTNAVPISIATPTDAAYPDANDLAVTVSRLPSNGTVFFADGLTAVGLNELLSVPELTSLTFQPAQGVAAYSSVFCYVVGDPDFATASGSVVLSIAGKGPGVTFTSLIAASDARHTVVSSGDVVTFSLSTSAPVTVTGAPTLQLNDNGVARYAGGSGSEMLTFTYTVQPGDNTPDLLVTGLALPNGATIQDGSGNPLATSLAGDFGIEVDTIAPTVTITSPGGQIDLATVTISGTVDGAQAGSQITLFDESTLIAITQLGSDGGWSAPATFISTGNHVVTAQATDAAGNTGTSDIVTYTSLTAPPIVSSITAVADNGAAHVDPGHLVTITLHATSPVNVLGIPTLQLNQNEVATYAGGSGTNTLTFGYTVQAWDYTPSLQVVGLNLPKGESIRDTNGNDLAGQVTQDIGLQIGELTGTSTPTNVEQFILQLINRAREDPSGEVARLILNDSPLVGANNAITDALHYYSVDINSLRQIISNAPSQPPLAFNSSLNNAADAHNFLMIQHNQQQHVLPGEQDLGQRFQAAGYTNWSSVGENIWAYATDPLEAHAAFFVDWGPGAGGVQNPPGHRDNLLSPIYTEIGISVIAVNAASPDVGPLVVTTDFGTTSNYQPQIVGVVYNDANHDEFYEPGEGLDGVSVTAVGAHGSFATTTWSSGGYGLSAPAGQYSLTISGGPLSSANFRTVVVGSYNLEADFIVGASTTSPSILSASASTVSQSSNVNSGHPISITLTLSESVTVTGTPTLQLNVNEVAAYTIGSGTDKLTFTYVVQPGDNTSDLHVTGLNLPNGASILDSDGNGLSGQVTADLGIQIDTTHVPPTSVQLEIMGLYAALYGRAAEAPGYEFWIDAAAQHPDMLGLTPANAGTTPVSAAVAQLLGEGFVLTQSTFFDQTYGALSDSDFVNAMYVNIGGNAGDPGGVQYWANLLHQAEAAGQSVQNARAGLVGQFVHDLAGFDTNTRWPGLTDQQWADAVTRTETINNKIAVSIAYELASQQPDGAILIPHAAGNDPAYQAAIRAIQGATSDGLTAAAAISNIAHAVADQDLTLIQPVGILNDVQHV